MPPQKMDRYGGWSAVTASPNPGKSKPAFDRRTNRSAPTGVTFHSTCGTDLPETCGELEFNSWRAAMPGPKKE